MAKNYVSEANKQLQGQYDAQKNELQNNFNQNMNDLDHQVGTTNKQYDDYVEQAKNQGQMNKQNYNNATLNRGLGRSSIATTGLAGIQNQTNKNVVSINNQRQAQMDNITRLKDMLRNNLTNSLNSLKSEHNSKVNSLAMELKYRDQEMAFKRQQLAQSAAQHNAEMAFKKQQLAQSAAQANREFNAAQKWKQKEWEMKQAQAKGVKASEVKFDMKKFNEESLSAYKTALSRNDQSAMRQIRDTMTAYGSDQRMFDRLDEYDAEWQASLERAEEARKKQNRFSVSKYLTGK